MSEEEELKKILTQAYLSNDKEFQKQAVDTAVTYRTFSNNVPKRFQY